MIQRHLNRSRKADPPNKAKIFAKLVMESQIDSALRYLSEEDCGGVLPLSKQVMEQLAHKHPEAQHLCYSGQWEMFRPSYISK